MKHLVQFCFALLLPLSACSLVPPAPGIPPVKPELQTLLPMVTTLAGTGEYGFAEGKEAQFYHPSSVVITPDHAYLLLDRYNLRIRKITAEGITSTFWSSVERGNRDGGPGTGLFNLPISLFRMATGELLIADAQNHTIRSLKDDQLSTLAGNSEGYQDGPAKQALFNWPSDLVSDGKGTLYVTDRYNHAIRKITADGMVSTLAGNGSPEYQDGNGKKAQFNEPMGLTFGPDGNLYVADSQNNVIRKVTLDGQVSTFAGSGLPGSREDSRLKAEFRQPFALVFGKDGSLYVSDRFNHRIRQVAPDGQVSTLAGTGKPGYQNGPGNQASFSYPYDLTFDDDNRLVVADYGNHALRRITLGSSKAALVDVSVLK